MGDEAAATMDDVYVQGGTDGDKISAAPPALIVKYDTGAQSYTRKSLMKFDLEHVPGDAEHIYLSYELTGMPSADFELLHIYRVENDWEERQ